MFNLIRRISLVLLLLSVLFAIAGCSVKSGPLEFTKAEPPRLTKDENAAEKLTRAFENTAVNGKKFWFAGWLGTKIQKRMIGFYIGNGTYDKDKGYLVDARVFGQPFRYYRWGKEVYLSEGDQWRQSAPSEMPLEPFADLRKLEFLTGKALKMPDETVLGKVCDVYRIDLDSPEVGRAAKALGVDLDPAKTVAGQVYYDKAKMRLVISVGKEDSFIYQFRAYTEMPLPDAGSMYQEISYKFWDYNSASINLPGPEKIAPYLVKD